MAFKDLIILTLISLTACGNPPKQSHLADSPLVPLAFTKHNSLEKFLDSLVQTPGITYAQTEPRCSADTFALGNNNFRIVKTAGGIIQSYHFYGFRKEVPFKNSADSCFCTLRFGTHKWARNDFLCNFEMECPEKNEITFGNTKFTYSIEIPMDNCLGKFCRVKYYPVFATSGRDTSLQVFDYFDDVIGLRYGDFDKDKFLDFLVPENSFSREELKNAVKRDKKWENLDCYDSQCYKITAITFKNGHWTKLKDRHGKPYYFLIWVNEFLNPEAGFELLDAHWVK